MTYFKARFRKENQDLINFIASSLSYIILAIVLGSILVLKQPFPRTINIFDFFLILFATLRLTEFFVYDKSMQFFRDLFVHIETIEVKKDEVKIEKRPINYGLRRTVHDLLTCPWCTSIWVATGVVFIYYLIPGSWIFLAIMAVSGLASIIQITSNMIGWNSERTEQKVKKEE